MSLCDHLDPGPGQLGPHGVGEGEQGGLAGGVGAQGGQGALCAVTDHIHYPALVISLC